MENTTNVCVCVWLKSRMGLILNSHQSSSCGSWYDAQDIHTHTQTKKIFLEFKYKLYQKSYCNEREKERKRHSEQQRVGKRNRCEWRRAIVEANDINWIWLNFSPFRALKFIRMEISVKNWLCAAIVLYIFVYAVRKT